MKRKENKKPKPFIGVWQERAIRSEAELNQALESVERGASGEAAAWDAADYTELADELERANGAAGSFDDLETARLPDSTRDAGLVASMLVTSAQQLRAVLARADAPAWEIAARAMEFARMDMIARQPDLWSAAGRANAEGKRPRSKQSEALTLKVLTYLLVRAQRAELRAGETVSDRVMQLLDEADGYEIEGVEIDKSVDTRGGKERHFYRFQKTDENSNPELVEKYAKGNLIRHKLPKAKKALYP